MFPAGLAGYSTRFVRIPSGLTIRVIEALGPGTIPALFIHGWGCSCFVWRRNLPTLATKGIRPFAIDLPGHGLSDKPLGAEHYRPDAMADAVVATIDAIGLEKAAIIAHSLGCVVARRVAARVPDRVTAMVLLAPVSIGRVPFIPLARVISPEWLQAIIPHLTFRWTIATGLWLARGGKTTLSDRDVDEYWAPTQFPEMTRAAVQMLHAFNWDPESSAIATPTFVIVAGGDRLVHVDPNSAYHVVPNAGHNVQEQAPDQVNSLVLSFLTP
jgi:pimeloyl-ACP methyl ester carboxylesterase